MNIMKYQDLINDFFHQLENFGIQFIEYYRLGLKQSKKIDLKKNLLICGMGGSGIGGKYIKSLNQIHSGKRYINLNSDYKIPKLKTINSNFIVISYSGNTEETVHMLKQLISQNLIPICISSGGIVEQIAKENNLLWLQLPKNLQPRMAFPIIFGYLVGILSEYINCGEITKNNEDTILNLSIKQTDEQRIGIMAKQLKNKHSIILSLNNQSAIGYRFRCQINENSKHHGQSYVIPEFSHNGIVGFDGNNSDVCVVLIESVQIEFSRSKIHFDFLKEFFHLKKIDYFIVKSNNTDALIEMLEITLFLDYLSIKLAEINRVDPMAIESIIGLKSKLKHVPL